MSKRNYVDFWAFQPITNGLSLVHKAVRMQRMTLRRRCSSPDGKHVWDESGNHHKCSACRITTYHKGLNHG